MTAREQVLARLRSALSDQPIVPAIDRTSRTHPATAPDTASIVAQFIERVGEYGADVTVTRPDALADAVAAAVGEGSVVVPAGLDPEWLTSIPSERIVIDGDPSVLSAPELDQIATVVTGSCLAIAVTATVVLDHGPDQGRRAISLLPDHHVCVVRAAQIFATVPEAVRAVDPHRPLTFISGPSATSDIELKRVQGVHGPRRLHVVIVAEQEHHELT